MRRIRVNKNSILLYLCLFVFSGATVFSQSAEEAKNIFTQAEAYYLYEEYDLANQLYLLIETPENMNIKHKIGTCYLNIPGEKEKSMAYLETAVKTASYDSKTESFKELRAPFEVYFSLAKAYMINNEFEKALTTLQSFSRITKENGGQMENLGFIDQQIQACKNAIQFRQVPVLFGKEALGEGFSMGSINENPAVSFDGNSIVYAERRGLENAIFYSKKVNGRWENPVEITAELNGGTDCSPTALNYDGTELFIYKTDNYDGVIYSSKYSDGKWASIQKLNKNINTKYYESHACISADGKKLYFASNRDGGLGNLDIYVSELDSKGSWGPAKNLGSDINTPFNEDTPFITENDEYLYFSSEGHNSMGGYDNYKSQKSGSGWKTPSNLGYPLNSADDDKFFQPANNGKNAFYSLSTGYKKKEIFYLDMTSSGSDKLYSVFGKLVLEGDSLNAIRNESVSVINRITSDTLSKVFTDEKQGQYEIDLSSGLFRILYSAKGYLDQVVDTLIAREAPAMKINIDIVLKPDTTAAEPVVFEKIDLSKIPVVEVADIDTSMLIRNLKVNDENEKSVNDSEVLYYTVQVIALHRPVDASYFKYVNDIKIIYNEDDKFYRYTTGYFKTKDEAYNHRSELIRKGYPKQIFVKKVSR
ncbi:MAG TPA: hypothetical protein VHO46_06250 [Bacteroidales bacterium]|nr:hypothetical protein [Bacteroidales bacterium]